MCGSFSTSAGPARWESEEIDGQMGAFTSKICFLGVVGFDTSGPDWNIYTVDSHNYTQMNHLQRCLHEESLWFLIQICVYSVFIFVLQGQSCFFARLHKRRASSGQWLKKRLPLFSINLVGGSRKNPLHIGANLNQRADAQIVLYFS